MKKTFLKRLLFIVPIIITIMMLFLIENTINHFKDTTYAFVYDTNKGSVQGFSREISELVSGGYAGKEYDAIYISMIKAFTKTNGEKNAIVSFLLDQDGNIYYGDDANESFVSALLEDPNNAEAINHIAISHSTGEVTLNNHGKGQTCFYQLITACGKSYYVFMTVDRIPIEIQLNLNRIVIPIVIIGLLLVITVENLIWVKMYCGTSTNIEGKIKCKSTI
ncbi:MAG: hypothetical protein FWC47_07395 [Oscillospiraceae bacterium]|nr:hypothetical protein [Oscillospiraceae bacterium]